MYINLVVVKDIIMFIPISLKKLYSIGKVNISVLSGWETISSTNSIPYNICYEKIFNNIYDNVILYTCYITISSQTIFINNLKRSVFIINSFYSEERTMYNLLKLILKKMISWSKETGRKNLIITSDLSHITEHFIDLDFSIKKEHGSFTGKKLLKK